MRKISLFQTCGKKFIEKHYLARHEVEAHNEVNPLTCNYCKKSFTRKKTFDRHMDCHKGIRPFLCDTCGMSYSSNKHLLRHKQRSCSTQKHGSNRYKVPLIQALVS